MAKKDSGWAHLFEGTGAGRGVFDGLTVGSPLDKQVADFNALGQSLGQVDSAAVDQAALALLTPAAENALAGKKADRLRGDPEWQGPPQVWQEPGATPEVGPPTVAQRSTVQGEPPNAVTQDYISSLGVEGPVGPSVVPTGGSEPDLPEHAAKPVFKASGPGVPVKESGPKGLEGAALLATGSKVGGVSSKSGKHSGPSADALSKGLQGPAEKAVTELAPLLKDVPSDLILDALKAKGEGLTKERQDALERALRSKDLNGDEKMALALLSTLPAIMGMIGGGIAAGATGATAGLAGGLTGGAQGVGMINAAKIAEKNDALALASEAGARQDKNDAAIGARTENLDNRDFETRQGAIKRGFEASQNDKDRALRAAEGAAQRRASMNEVIMQNKGAMDRMRTEMELKRKEAGMGPAKPPSESDLAYNSNSAIFQHDLKLLGDTVKKFGTYEAPYIGDQNARSILGQKPQQLAIEFAKLVDPATAAREGEVQNMIDNIMNIGATTSVDQATASITALQDFAQKHSFARELAKQGYTAAEITKQLGNPKYLPGPDAFVSSASPAAQDSNPWSKGRPVK